MPTKEQWLAEFRGRLPGNRSSSASIKIAVESGCFHREHSPRAYALIDKEVRERSQGKAEDWVHEHETGPEIIAYLALGAAGLSFAKSVIDLACTIIKARVKGVKEGDHPRDPLVLIVRGVKRDGEYFEEKLLRFEINSPVERVVIEKAPAEAVARHLSDDGP